MNVAKRFRWEGAHRLPWHEGGCQNLHGHSYELWVEVTGDLDERGMLVDFKDVKRALGPLVDAWDHATLVAEADEELRAVLQTLGSKHFVLPFDTTSENMVLYVLAYLAAEGGAGLLRSNVHTISARLQETETCYASAALTVAQARELARTLLKANSVGGDGAIAFAPVGR